MGAEPSGMCRTEHLLASKNNIIAWSFHFINQKYIHAIKFYWRSIHSIDSNISKKCGDEDGFISGDIVTWSIFCIYSLLILIIITIYKLQMERLKKIPFNIFLPHTKSNCSCCDKIDEKISSKFGFIHKSFETWNCAKVILSTLFTYLMFGLGISFDPYYQIQNEPDVGICKCWSEELEAMSIAYVFILLSTSTVMIYLCWCNICWCCSVYACKSKTLQYIFIILYRMFACLMISLVPIPAIGFKITSWIINPVIPFTVTNVYAFICIILFLIGLVICFVYYKVGKYENSRTKSESSILLGKSPIILMDDNVMTGDK
eukprot:418473_1